MIRQSSLSENSVHECFVVVVIPMLTGKVAAKMAELKRMSSDGGTVMMPVIVKQQWSW